MYETRSKDKLQEKVDLVRHKEAVIKSTLIESRRTRTKTKRNELEGYDILY